MTHGDTNDRSVSVIVPAFNAEASLGRTIQSALAQELPPHELIVIDDGSTDRTLEVAHSFAGRITCLTQENKGQGAARNAGLAVASGRLIAFVDADDYWHPAFLKHCVEFLEAHPEAIAVSTGIIVHLWGKQERRWPPPSASGVAAEYQSGVLDNFFDYWGRHDHVRTGSNVIRRTGDRPGWFSAGGSAHQSGPRILGILGDLGQVGTDTGTPLDWRSNALGRQSGLAE